MPPADATLLRIYRIDGEVREVRDPSASWRDRARLADQLAANPTATHCTVVRAVGGREVVLHDTRGLPEHIVDRRLVEAYAASLSARRSSGVARLHDALEVAANLEEGAYAAFGGRDEMIWQCALALEAFVHDADAETARAIRAVARRMRRF